MLDREFGDQSIIGVPPEAGAGCDSRVATARL
jgi:hypothetical protein